MSRLIREQRQKSPARLFLACVSVVFVSLTVYAQDEPKKADPVDVELQRAMDEYRQVKKKAAEKLLAAFDREANAIKNDAMLDVEDKVERLVPLEEERKAFLLKETAPKSADLAKELETYQAEVLMARRTCNTAFKDAANKALQIDLEKAKSILAERDAFFKPGGDKQARKVGNTPGALDFGDVKSSSGTDIVQGVEVKTGAIQFTLIWDSKADLDLHVVEPGKSEIYWENRSGKQGGQLDVDDVDGFGPENIFFSQGGETAKGEYRWFVHYYGGLGGLNVPTRWKVRVKQGDKTEVFQGKLTQIGVRSTVYLLKVE